MECPLLEAMYFYCIECSCYIFLLHGVSFIRGYIFLLHGVSFIRGYIFLLHGVSFIRGYIFLLHGGVSWLRIFYYSPRSSTNGLVDSSRIRDSPLHVRVKIRKKYVRDGEREIRVGGGEEWGKGEVRGRGKRGGEGWGREGGGEGWG